MQPRSITIVGSDATAPGATALVGAIQDQGYTARMVLISDENIAKSINSSECVIYRIKPDTYARFAAIVSEVNAPHRQKLTGVLKAFDKIRTSAILAEAHIPTPRSWVIVQGVSHDAYPVIIKIANGNQGSGVALLRSAEDLSAFMNDYPNDESFLLQEYIEEAKSSDKRLFVSGDRVVCAMKRESGTDDFRANLHLGGTAVSYDPTEAEKQMAIKASQLFGLDFSGVDLIDSNRGSLVLEVNSSPGFAISGITGIDVVEEVIKDIMKEYYD